MNIKYTASSLAEIAAYLTKRADDYTSQAQATKAKKDAASALASAAAFREIADMLANTELTGETVP